MLGWPAAGWRAGQVSSSYCYLSLSLLSPAVAVLQQGEGDLIRIFLSFPATIFICFSLSRLGYYCWSFYREIIYHFKWGGGLDSTHSDWTPDILTNLNISNNNMSFIRVIFIQTIQYYTTLQTRQTFLFANALKSSLIIFTIKLNLDIQTKKHRIDYD